MGNLMRKGKVTALLSVDCTCTLKHFCHGIIEYAVSKTLQWMFIPPYIPDLMMDFKFI